MRSDSSQAEPHVAGPAPRPRRRHRLLAVAAALLAALATFAPTAGAQTGNGLDCAPATPEPGDTVACVADGLEPAAAFTWTATFADDSELTDDGVVTEDGEAHFDFEAPDAEGEFTVVLESIDEDGVDVSHEFTGTIQAAEEEEEENGTENGTEDGTEDETVDDTTTTTELEDDSAMVTEFESDITVESGPSDDEVAGAAIEATTEQIDVLPAAGVATGIGPPEDSRAGAAAALGAVAALLAVAATVGVARGRRRRGQAAA